MHAKLVRVRLKTFKKKKTEAKEENLVEKKTHRRWIGIRRDTSSSRKLLAQIETRTRGHEYKNPLTSTGIDSVSNYSVEYLFRALTTIPNDLSSPRCFQFLALAMIGLHWGCKITATAESKWNHYKHVTTYARLVNVGVFCHFKIIYNRINGMVRYFIIYSRNGNKKRCIAINKSIAWNCK